MNTIEPRRHAAILRRRGISLAEWYVLNSIGTWPMPVENVASVVASHSDGDPRGPITSKIAKQALQACIGKGWLNIVDNTHLKMAKRAVALRKSFGPIYGYPLIGEVDLTVTGARLYKNLLNLLHGAKWNASFGYRLELRRKARFFYAYQRDALRAVKNLEKQGVPVVVSRPGTIGPWCVYWWKQFPRGYSVDVLPV